MGGRRFEVLELAVFLTEHQCSLRVRDGFIDLAEITSDRRSDVVRRGERPCFRTESRFENVGRLSSFLGRGFAQSLMPVDDRQIEQQLRSQTIAAGTALLNRVEHLLVECDGFAKPACGRQQRRELSSREWSVEIIGRQVPIGQFDRDAKQPFGLRKVSERSSNARQWQQHAKLLARLDRGFVCRERAAKELLGGGQIARTKLEFAESRHGLDRQPMSRTVRGLVLHEPTFGVSNGVRDTIGSRVALDDPAQVTDVAGFPVRRFQCPSDLQPRQA